MSSVLTIAEAALDLQVNESLIWSYHRRGLLDVMYTRNVGAAPSRRGPRDARIDRAEWARFKRTLTIRRDAQPSADGETDAPRRGRPRTGVPRAEGPSKWLKGYKGAQS
jgi:hypothetical protein